MRDFQDPQYKAWRLQVYKRDKFKCRLCLSKVKLNAHHIKRWAEYPQLRYVLSNGITLCSLCHRKVTGMEDYYEALFLQLVNPDSFIRMSLLLHKMRKDNENRECSD